MAQIKNQSPKDVKKNVPQLASGKKGTKARENMKRRHTFVRIFFTTGPNLMELWLTVAYSAKYSLLL